MTAVEFSRREATTAGIVQYRTTRRDDKVIDVAGNTDYDTTEQALVRWSGRRRGADVNYATRPAGGYRDWNDLSDAPMSTDALGRLERHADPRNASHWASAEVTEYTWTWSAPNDNHPAGRTAVVLTSTGLAT